jgi:hypothetical protein
MKTSGDVNSSHMVVHDHLQTQAALAPEKEPPAPIGQKVEC